MTKFFFISICFLLMLCGSGFSQSRDEAISLGHFRDSISQTLRNSMDFDTAVVGNFTTAWNQLNIVQKKTIQSQAQNLRIKKYKKASQADYCKAFIVAVVEGQIGEDKLNEYLNVAGQVIEYENLSGATKFFRNVYHFFKEKSLHSDRSFQLYAREDTYYFDYIARTEQSSLLDMGSGTEEDYFDDQRTEDEQVDPGYWDEEDEQDNLVFEENSAQDSDIPLWMQPADQPELVGPIIQFDRVQLNFFTPYDSVLITNTKGGFAIIDNLFVGEGGTFDWSSMGLPRDSVYFTFQQYHLDTTKPIIKAEQGEMTYVGNNPKTMKGVFEYRSVARRKSEQTNYPQFQSFSDDIQFSKLESYDIKLKGGFSLKGKKIYSSSLNANPAHLEILKEGNKQIHARSISFEFEDSTVISRNAAVTIYQGRDSLYQLFTRLYYNFINRRLVLRKEQKGFKNTPYSASYFKTDFLADKLEWDTDSDSVYLYVDGGRSQAPMIFESSNFYDPEDFRILTGQGFGFHPLALLANYAIKNNTREFYVNNMAQATGQPVDKVRMAMDFLSGKGMVDYNSLTDRIKVNEKSIAFYESRKGERDYDHIKIHSVVDGPANAILSLQDKSINIRGVEKFNMSSGLNLLIEPDSASITLHHNREIQFNGRITAGNFEINGRDFVFKYDSFLIFLNHIDSIRFYVTKTDIHGQKIRHKLNNSVVGAEPKPTDTDKKNIPKSSGTLYINRSDNKSERVTIPNYPRLDATTGGVMYFDKKDILNGVYDRSVYYAIPPFKLDSLNNTNFASINFDGTFFSGGILPPLKQSIRVGKDQSFGFAHTIPDQGYPLFQGTGKLYGTVGLNNKGIRANGKINYLSTTVTSKDFILYPDSIAGMGSKGEIKEQQIGKVWFPQVSLPAFKLTWLPRQDLFNIKNFHDPFILYEGSAQLNGRLTISKKGFFGGGVLTTHGFRVTSEHFIFSAKQFESRNAAFQLETLGTDQPALVGSNVNLQFNLEQNYAEIRPEVIGEASLEFPHAQFKTSIPEARWDLKAQKVTMEKDVNTYIEDSFFYSTNEDMDSLNFSAERAEYDIKEEHIKVSGIPFIIVADAKIIPENHEILILENSKISRLENADIILDTLNGYHHLIRGEINILSRKMFNGRATYQYVNTERDTFAIKMTDFRTESVELKKQSNRSKKKKSIYQQTVASGTVTQEDSLILDSRIYYKGDMTMYANRPALELNGSIKLDLKNIENYNTWILYEQDGYERQVFVDFDNAIIESGKRIGAGLHFDSENNLYTTFAFDKKSQDDDDFFVPSGSLFFDKTDHKFHIENRLRASGEKLTGKAFIYDEKKQEVVFEGRVHFFKEEHEKLVTASVLGKENLKTKNVKMNALLMVNIAIPRRALQLMAEDLTAIQETVDIEEGLGDQTELLYKLADLVSEREIESFEKKSTETYVPLTTLRPLIQPLVFSNVNLRRSKKNKTFHSIGTLGLSNILTDDINGAFEGFMELKTKKDGSSVFHVFFKAASDVWYSFNLEDDRLLIHSSNNLFNDIINKQTNAHRARLGEIIFVPGSDEETVQFIDRFRKQYYNINTPYNLRGEMSYNEKREEEIENDGF